MLAVVTIRYMLTSNPNSMTLLSLCVSKVKVKGSNLKLTHSGLPKVVITKPSSFPKILQARRLHLH